MPANLSKAGDPYEARGAHQPRVRPFGSGRARRERRFLANSRHDRLPARAPRRRRRRRAPATRAKRMVVAARVILAARARVARAGGCGSASVGACRGGGAVCPAPCALRPAPCAGRGRARRPAGGDRKRCRLRRNHRRLRTHPFGDGGGGRRGGRCGRLGRVALLFGGGGGHTGSLPTVISHEASAR
eukprot:6749453-Prymnesium_polylepis.2